MCQEKKEEEDLVALRIGSMDQYKDSRTTLKCPSPPHKIITAASNSIDSIRKKNKTNKNCNQN